MPRSLRSSKKTLQHNVFSNCAAAIRTAKHKEDRLSQWVTALAQRSHPNVAAAALANKTTRIAWAMLRKGTDYQPNHGSC